MNATERHPNLRARRRVALGLLVVAAVVSALPRAAVAYNGTEHIRHADQAYQVLNLMRRGAAYAAEAQRLDPAGALAGKYRPLTQCPEALCPASTCLNGACPVGRQWSRFVAQALAAPAKLDRVRTDLSDAPPPLVAGSCGGALPKLAPGELARCRIGELSFAPRRGWGTNANECFVRSGYVAGGADQNPPDTEQHASGPVLPFFQELQTNFSGAAIGFWSTGPDGATEDTKLWFRPSNLVFLGAVKQAVQNLGELGALTGLMTVAPIFCLADLVFGGGDCFDDARSAAHVVANLGDETVAVFEQSTVGQLTTVSVDALPLPGLWHFGRVDGQGQFNQVAGLNLVEGGPNGQLDDLDEAVILVTDFVGATLHSDESLGIQRYAPFADGDLRTVGDWLGQTVGHVELEPVQNLAQWGWTQFRDGKLNAKGLGWVLHAIGDAGQPHHTISTIGWGHAEWEKLANLTWEENFREEDLLKHYPDLQETVALAFRWWQFLDERQARSGGADLAVRELVVALLKETAHLPVSTVGRAYQRGLSSVTSTSTRPDDEIRWRYGSETASMKDLMQRAIGASMAFLVKASDFVSTAGESPCDCGPGASRFAQDASGTIVTARDGLCHPCGKDAFSGMPSWMDGACVAACPPDQPTSQAGTCVATGVCPADRPFVESGACVARCPDTKVVVNNLSCEAACPAPQRADAAGFCRTLPVVPARMCVGPSEDTAKACCSPVGAAVQSVNQCCSLDRNPGGLCRGNAGDRCVVDDDCVSLSCVGRRCALGPNGGRCRGNQDCASTSCSESHICLGAGGDPCWNGWECESGRCAATQGSVGRCDT